MLQQVQKDASDIFFQEIAKYVKVREYIFICLYWIYLIGNMHFVCGQTIAQTERGGYIVFDADLLPVGHEDDCSVVIQPKPTYNQVTPGSYVLFYFSGFQIGNNCQDMYVEVNDGTGINIDPIKGIQ